MTTQSCTHNEQPRTCSEHHQSPCHQGKQQVCWISSHTKLAPGGRPGESVTQNQVWSTITSSNRWTNLTSDQKDSETWVETQKRWKKKNESGAWDCREQSWLSELEGWHYCFSPVHQSNTSQLEVCVSSYMRTYNTFLWVSYSVLWCIASESLRRYM